MFLYFLYEDVVLSDFHGFLAVSNLDLEFRFFVLLSDLLEHFFNITR